jgi:hypothetical protein
VPASAAPRFAAPRQAPKAALAVLALSALLITACGGDKKTTTVTPSSFVSQVCTSVGTWQRSIASGSNELDHRLGAATSAADAKRALEELVAAWVVNSETVVARLRAAGVPAVKDGETISAALVNTFEKARADLQSLEGQVKSLPTGGSALRVAATRLSTSLQGSLANIGVGLQGLHSEELRKAAEQSAACQSLGSTAG